MSNLDDALTRRLDRAARVLSIAASNAVDLMEACRWHRGRGARLTHRDAWPWIVDAIDHPGAVRGPLRALYAEAEARLRIHIKSRRRSARRAQGARRG